MDIIKIKKITLLLFLCCCAFAQQTVSSQTENRDSLTTVEISMYDGNIFLGDIIAETESEYTLRTKSGIEIQIPKSRVKEIVEMTITEVKGEVYRPDPNKSMYLFAPSAFPIEHDKSYCRDFCLFFPSYNRGFTNNISLQAGAFVFPGMPIEEIPIVASGKISLPAVGQYRFATGIMFIKWPDWGSSEEGDDGGINGSGFAFATATTGDRFSHLSASLGWGYSYQNNTWDFSSDPIVVLGGNYRMTTNLALVFEFWKPSEAGITESPIMTAVRFIGRKISVDLGGLYILDMEGIPMPLLNFTYHMD